MLSLVLFGAVGGSGLPLLSRVSRPVWLLWHSAVGNGMPPRMHCVRNAFEVAHPVGPLSEEGGCVGCSGRLSASAAPFWPFPLPGRVAERLELIACERLCFSGLYVCLFVCMFV